MSLPWVKLHTSLRYNLAFRRSSPGAKLTFMMCLMVAGDLDQGDYSGRLDVPRSGPYTLDELAGDTGMRAKLQKDALDELVSIGFLSRDASGAYVVERFEEKAAPLSAISTTRTRKYKERNRSVPGTGGERSPERSRNRAEAEAEAEANYASLRSAAFDGSDGTVAIPTDRTRLQAIAFALLARFANIHDPAKAMKRLGMITPALREAARKGVTIADAWSACETAWEDGARRPMFTAMASALRATAQAKSISPRAIPSNGRASSQPTVTRSDMGLE